MEKLIFRKLLRVTIDREAKRNFAVHRLPSRDQISITDEWSSDSFESIIGDVIGTVATTTTAVSRKSVRKSRFEKCPSYSASHSNFQSTIHSVLTFCNFCRLTFTI